MGRAGSKLGGRASKVDRVRGSRLLGSLSLKLLAARFVNVIRVVKRLACYLATLQERGGKPAKRLSPAVRAQVWKAYHSGSRTGRCYCCGVPIQRDRAWHCAHVVPRALGGEDSVPNLRTCCAYCNLAMGKGNLYEFIRRRGLRGPGATKGQGKGQGDAQAGHKYDLRPR